MSKICDNERKIKFGEVHYESARKAYYAYQHGTPVGYINEKGEVKSMKGGYKGRVGSSTVYDGADRAIASLDGTQIIAYGRREAKIEKESHHPIEDAAAYVLFFREDAKIQISKQDSSDSDKSKKSSSKGLFSRIFG